MKQSAKSPASPSPHSDWLERLADAVNRLTDEVHVARDVIDEFRTDFAWLLQNGMPHPPQEIVVIKRMARDPNADDWNQHLVVERFPIPESTAGQPSLSMDDLESFALEIQSAFTGIAEGQLDIVLTALDELRSRILAALAARSAEPLNSTPAPATQETPPPDAIAVTSKQGELF